MNEITYAELERGCTGFTQAEFLAFVDYWLLSGDFIPEMVMNPWREESHGR